MKLVSVAIGFTLVSLAVLSACASHPRSHDRKSEQASVILVEHTELSTNGSGSAWDETLKTMRTPAGGALDAKTIEALHDVLGNELKQRMPSTGDGQKITFLPVLVPIIAAVVSTLVGVGAQQAGQAIQKEGEDYAASWSAKAYKMDYWTKIVRNGEDQLAPRYGCFAVVRTTKKGDDNKGTPSFILLCAMIPAEDKATFEVAPLMLYAPNSKAKLSAKGKLQLDIGFELAAWWEDATGNPKHATIGSSEVPLRIAYDVDKAPLVLWASTNSINPSPEDLANQEALANLDDLAKKDGIAIERRNPVTLAIAHHCPPSRQAQSRTTVSLRRQQLASIKNQLKWIKQQLNELEGSDAPRQRFLKELEEKLGRELVSVEVALVDLESNATNHLASVENLGGTFRIAVEVREADESKLQQHLLLIGRSIESSSSALKDATAKGIGNIPTE